MLAQRSARADEDRPGPGPVRGAGMGEARQAYALSEAEAGACDQDAPLEQLARKDRGDFEHGLPGGSEAGLPSGPEHGPPLAGLKDKEPHSQREAVIRPQQAGKIDFKSLQRRPEFPGDGPWGPSKGSPQSPTGKGRAREKSRRAGKGERGQQQLYRLTISNARPNPTIGIAYPQQKVTPPRKAPVSGSYRFHVPSVPEREAELRQEELGFARGFPEAPSGPLPGNYASATAKLQPAGGGLHESPGGQLHYLEFQGHGSGGWPLPDKSLPGASGGLPAPKPCSFPESDRPGVHCLGPLPFPSPFQPLRGSAPDPFPGEAGAQDYAGATQASRGAFTFHASSRDWKEGSGGPYDDHAGPEGRAYGLAPPPGQFLPAPGPLPCYKGRGDPATDPAHGALSPPGAIDPALGTFQEGHAVFPHGLHVPSGPKPLGSQRGPPPAHDSAATPRALGPGSSLRRNGPPLPLPQVHFQNEPYADPPAGSLSPGGGPYEKSLPAPAQAHPRLLQAWEGGKRPFSPLEASSTLHPSPAGGALAFGGHLGLELRPPRKKPWPPLHLAPAVPGQSRVELPRKPAGQKLPFPLGAAEWEGSRKAPKGGASYPGRALLTGEGAIMQRLEPGPSSPTGTLGFAGTPDPEPLPSCAPRSKALYFGLGQAGPPVPPRLPPGSALALPSPSSSPLPSPAPHPASSSTCSSLSPLSSSPPSHSLEDGVTLASPPYFHLPKDGPKPFPASEPASATAAHCQAPGPSKPFQPFPAAPREKVFCKGLAADSHFPKPAPGLSKAGLGGFEAELPPPPYASHHLLASSLSSASLDQLDVFLTCKQCDQNFSNLSSFLEHRQFCSSHAALQGLPKDPPRGPDARRQQQQQQQHPSALQAGQGFLLPPPEVPLLPLNKALDFLADGEGKGGAKEDPLKGAQFGSLATHPLPLSASELDIDEAKLDSLITEALNGLGYQSDSPEIDSSFIDVFADEELVPGKGLYSGAPCKAKEGLAAGQKAKLGGAEESLRAPSCCDDHPSGDPAQSRVPRKQLGHREGGTGWLPDHGEKRLERPHGTEPLQSKAAGPGAFERAQVEAGSHLKACRKKPCSSSFSPFRPAARAVADTRRPKPVQQAGSPGSRTGAAGDPKRPAADSRKRKLRSGTWSKELIHKIVQQKNKLNKRHGRGSKGGPLPLPLPAGRPLPEAQDSRFGEYEYISESDEERVEYAKQHCRRKLGARLGGRLRSGFGWRGREQDPEPAWRHGQRRGREEEPKREPGWRGGCAARARRRSSRSSTSSRQSTSLSSETSPSPPSPERADSEGEKERQPRRRHLPSPRPAGPRPDVPRKEPAGRSRERAAEPPRGGSPDLSPLGYPLGEEGLPQTPGGSPRSQGPLGKAPTAPQQCRGHGQATAAPRELDPRALGAPPPWRQLTASPGEASGFPVEDFASPLSSSNHSTPNCQRRDPKFPRGPKDVTLPVSCFSHHLAALGVAEKRSPPLVNTADPFYDCSELSSGYEPSALFPGPPGTAPPPSADSLYFCQEDPGLGSFKAKPPEIPPSYEANHEHRKASLPLGFDSPPVFGELPIAEFDATLYEGVSSDKESYLPFACAGHQLGKMTPFDQHYASFLHEKDWSVMEEMPSVVQDDIAPFQTLSAEKPLARKCPAAGGQMLLPERLGSYAAPFANGLSDDELEIKRLVTELENQLQSSKLGLEASPEDQVPKLQAGFGRKEAPGQFSPLRLDPESDGKELFLIEMAFENASLVPTKACACEDPADEKALLPPLDSSHRDPWPCPVPFSPLQPPAEDLLLGSPFSSKEAHEKLHEALQDADIPREGGFREIPSVPPGIAPESCLANSRGAPSYTDSLMQSPGPLFPQTLDIHEALPTRADAFSELQHKAASFEDPAGLEPFSHPTPGELQAQEAGSSLHSRTPNREDPEEEESLCCKAATPEALGRRTPFQGDGEEAGEAGLASPAGRTPALPGQAGEGDRLLLESLAFSVETGGNGGFAPAPQGKGATPLQQLQLFVARTAKHNEEALLMPCFPALHSSPHLPLGTHVQPEQGEEAADVAGSPTFQEEAGPVGEEPESVATEPLLGPCQQVERLGEKVSEPAGLRGSDPHQDVGVQQHLEGGCSELGDGRTVAGGASPGHGPPSPLSSSAATSLPREKGAAGTRVAEEVAGEPRRAAWALKSRQTFPLSAGPFEKEAPACALPAGIRIRAAGCASWGDAHGKDPGAPPVNAPQAEEFGQLQGHLSLGTPNPPESQHQGGFLLRQTSLGEPASHRLDVSPDGFPVEADWKCGQDDDAGNAACADFRAQQSGGAQDPPSGEDQPLHQDSATAGGAVAGDCTQRPPKQKEWKEALTSCRGDSTNLPSSAIGSQQQGLVEDTPNDLTDLPPPPATSLLSGDLAAPLLGREGGLTFQNTKCHSPSMSPFQPGDLSEGPPESPDRGDREACPARGSSSSSPLGYLQSILLGRSPSGTNSAPLTDARTSAGATDGCQDLRTSAELSLNPQGARAVESGPQERGRDQTLPEICRRDAGLREGPATSLLAVASGAEAHLRASLSPETTERGPHTASHGSGRESQEPEPRDAGRGVPSCVEQAESQSERRKRSPKGRRPRGKDGKDLPVPCDVCAAPFRSRAGLLRHRAVKHAQEEDLTLLLLLHPGLAPGEAGKPATRKGRRGSRKPSPAPGRPFPKPCQSRRKGSRAGVQGVGSRGLSGSREPSLALRSPAQPSPAAPPKPESPQAAGVAEAAPGSGREPTSGGKGHNRSAGGAGSPAQRTVKRTVRKGKRKGGPGPHKATGAAPLADASPEVCSQATPSPAACLPRADLGGSSPSAGGQARVQSPGGDAGRGSSAEEAAGPPPLQGGGSGAGRREDPGPGERLHAQEPGGPLKPAEEGWSPGGEEQHRDPGGQEASPWGEASGGDSGRPPVCTASADRLQAPCEARAETKGFAPPCPADSTPWAAGEEPGPRSVPGGCGAAGPDLQSLLDDDSTFSQLFPRNGRFARRKCPPRVYGKRTKKPKPAAEVSARPEVAADPFTVRMASDLGETSAFCVTREDPCEFETISLDDALMLNICHGSSAAGSDPGLRSAPAVPPPAEATEESTLSFRGPGGGQPGGGSWSERAATGASADGALLHPSAELPPRRAAGEASPGTQERQEEPHDPPLKEDRAPPPFRTIDVAMLSSKFETRDVCFYSREEDRLAHTEDCPLGVKSPALPQGRGARSKPDEGKPGKARGDLALKRKEKQYKCKVCFQWFLTLGELDFHKLTHNPSPPPTCYMCVQRKFSSREQLRDHLKEKHAKNKAGLWACGMCLKEISDVWMYNEHLREHATQFARKDQAQKSVLGLPGCFGEDDAAVTHFLNSIMYRKQSKSSRPPEAAGKGPPCQEGRSPQEPPAQAAKASREPPEGPPRAKPAAASPRAPAVLSPDPAPKGEGAQRLAPMHPECKDPSRDCHHCGKQFPKPFKLQRHLVVHSLQKIYLCPRCPLFYPETKELRSHLGQEHGPAGEADVRHTTLYACELCADVMHVIKKSFICSACNYTFSKKEQYDRHMEKHLVGSRKPFRFRGVMRPSASAREEDRRVRVEAPPREGTPVAKKKKLAHPHGWLAQGCAPGPQPGLGPLLPPTKPPPTRPPAQPSVKAEVLAADLSGFLAEMEEAPFDFLSLPPPLPAPQDGSRSPELRHVAALSRVQPANGASLGESSPPFLDSPDAVSIDLASSAHQPAAGRKLPPPPLSEKHKPAAAPEEVAVSSGVAHATGTWGSPPLQEEPGCLLPALSAAGLEAGEDQGCPGTEWSSSPHLASEEGVPKLQAVEAASHPSPLKDKAPSAALSQLAKETPSKKAPSGQAQSEAASGPHGSPGSTEGAQKPPSLQAPPELGAYPRGSRPSAGTSQGKPVSSHVRGEGAAAQAPPHPPDVSRPQDRAGANGLAKPHPRKRKEHKSAHKGSSASRENLEGGSGKKKRKVRPPDPARSDGAGGLRRADWSNGEALALSPRRRDAHCNRLTPKPKGGPPKKTVLGQCLQKKAELRFPHGDVRPKKESLGGKAFHPLLAKEPSPALPSAFPRHRTVQGAKPPECHNYRTAESQNNLLSQLFGQKLTSFKIPLRRDTSE